MQFFIISVNRECHWLVSTGTTTPYDIILRLLSLTWWFGVGNFTHRHRSPNNFQRLEWNYSAHGITWYNRLRFIYIWAENNVSVHPEATRAFRLSLECTNFISLQGDPLYTPLAITSKRTMMITLQVWAKLNVIRDVYCMVTYVSM